MGYVLLRSSEARPGLGARATLPGGVAVPCSLFALEDDPEHAWVAVVPLLSRTCTLELRQGDEVVRRVNFSPRRSKVQSRLLTARKPHVAAELRGYEARHAHGRPNVCIGEAWPADDGRVAWRMRATFPTDDAGPRPCLRVYDERAAEVGATVVTMEDHVVPDPRNEGLFQRLVTFSALVPEGLGSFHVVATLGDDRSLDCFAGMNAPRAAAMVAHARQVAGGAPVDPRYETWFEGQRASRDELARQAAACAARGDELPLISIVMPVYRTPGAFLEAAVRSVVEQSYSRWELVVVNASGPCDEVDEVLGRVRDDRVRVIAVENRSIAENTNAGIEATRGAYVAFLDHDDVLEPDALWWYAQTIVQRPHVDLLYCDEDHLAGSHVHAPAFKTYPNYGKLYTHNYVTHLLMVSRHVLDHTERTEPELSGAQDFDLTLKAFEVARDVAHVPRVLYHWREHEGSTSGGGDQKPYAHEAGRKALEAHLGRRAIDAVVDDGPLPYTYRMRFELPRNPELVSVVIPTRDQADLLRTCVTSILQRSTYPRLEVVLVENNSEQPQTFALYDELVAQDPRVRVVTWTPPEPGAFNYSAVVNHGVSCSSGSLLVLLNNDTEVIEPAWIEEMAGCLMRPEVGVVGAKLLFGDGLIQHVGMVANPSGDNCHVCQNLTRDAHGAGYAALLPGDCSMVTGACQMVRRSLFDELGGYDERLAVGFNDADFCLRAGEAGHVVTVAAYALLHHREFSTRGREITDPRLRQRFLEEKAYTLLRHPRFYAEGDPGLNPNVNGYSPYFELG